MLRTRRWIIALLAVAVFVGGGLVTHTLAQDPDPDALLRTGDSMYAEKSYRQAQEAYEAYLKSAPDDKHRARVSRNLGMCAWRLSEFDKALAVQEAAARDFKGTRDEVLARRQRLMMRLSMPDYYYEKDGKKYWGRWVQQASYHHVGQQNRTDALANIRAAHDLWAELFQAIESPSLADVQLLAQLKMELASMVESDDAENAWEVQTVKVELPDGSFHEYQERVNTWPHKADVIKLYDDAEQLYARTANLGADREAVLHGGLALYRKAMFFCHMAQLGQFRFGPQDDDRQRSTLPTVDNPMPALREVIAKYPDSRRAPEAWYAICVIHRQLGEYNTCLDELRKLRETYPKSKWVSDTLGVEQSITMPRLAVSGTTSIKPGEKLTLNVTSRNVKEIAFTAYRFDLKGLMTDGQFLADPQARLDNLSSLQNQYAARYRGDQLGTWTVDTKDEGEHLYFVDNTITAQIADDYTGSFLVVATAGNITISSLHVRTERVIMVRGDTAASLWWYVDRDSGEPLDNAQFHYKEYFRWRIGRENHYGTSNQVVAGDDAGVVRRDNVVRGPRVPGNAWTQGVICVAVDADGNFALTNTAQPRAWSNDWNDHYRWLTWTERPVYRPEQEVFFRGIIKQYQKAPADFANVAGQQLTWEVRDPRNQKAANGTLSTGPAGTFHSSLKIGDDATLGTWRVILRFANNNRVAHSFHFRVEEYKKPEFEVSVTPASDRVKLGKEGEAKVSVRYYSGEPVSGAKAVYRVFRNFHWRTYHFPRDWDWFYADWVHEREQHGWGRDMVANGEATCDENGEFTVKFPTENAAKNWPDYKHNYTIEIEATDESRRTINGAGSILVTKNAFDAYVQTRRNLYTPGDRVEFEVRTETPAGKPVAVKGKLHIGRLDVYWTTEEDENGNKQRVRKRDEKFFHSIDVATDEEGRAFVEWVMDSPGQFVVKFESTDPDGETITNSHDFLVAGNDDNLETSRFSELRIVPEQRVYEIGGTARVALTAVEKGTYVMFRVETGQDRAPYEIHHLNGRVQTIDIPITKRLVPNFFITAYAIRDGVVQEARTEIFVMPMNRLLNVDVTADKDTYLPGTTGTVNLKVTDQDGKPVSAEASVGVVDASLYYIAADNTPDPRTFYYKRRRGFSVQTYSSLTFRSGGHRVDANSYKQYQNHGQVEGWTIGWGGWVRHDLQMRRNQLGGPAPETGWEPVSKEAAENDEQAMVPPRNADNADAGGFGNGGGGGWGGRPGNGFRSRGGAGAPGGMDNAAPQPNAAPMDRNEDSGADFDGEGGEEMERQLGGLAEKAQANGGAAQPVVPAVRRDFRDLAAWHPSVVTAEDGTASVEVKWPDNLTRWKTNVVVVDDQNRMGYATLSMTTTKNIKVRLQAPRFFVETDEVVLSAVVSNDLKMAKDVEVKITVPEHLELMAPTPASVTVKLDAGQRDRVDWRVKVVKAGVVTVRMDALTDVESDAQEMTFPAYIHGATKHAIVTGRIAGEGGEADAEVQINVPETADPARTQLRISINPTVVNSALDALPYLIQYPYGCVEQTMSRFMPAVAVRKTLSDLGVDLDEVAAARKNVNLEAWPAQYQVSYRNNPAFDQAMLNEVIRLGLARLYDFQHADGGWGWWKGGHSDPYMTAYVLQGFIIAMEADVAIDQNRLLRGLNYLSSTFEQENNLHRAAYLSHVLAFAHSTGRLPEAAQARLNGYVTQVFEKREHLGNYTRSLLLMSLHWLERAEETAIVKRNLVGYAHHDNDNSTSWFGQPGEGGWWWWHNDRIEQNAWALRALNAVEPKHELVPRITKWLVNNRKGNRWHSTRATAFAILALADHAKVHRELDAEYQLEVELDGKVLRTVQVTQANMFSLDGEIFLTGAEVPAGNHTLRLVRRGMGSCYFTADLEYFEKKEGIEAAGHEIFVKRTYYKLTERYEELADGRKIQKWDREELKDGEVLESGQLLEVELRIDAKNDYEYLCFEDWKPAGCEPLASRSGGHWANGIWIYREFRDEKVVMFVGRMQQGYVKLDYRLRCEIPGRFHALPTQGYGMYAPDLKTNSAEAIITITDADND